MSSPQIVKIAEELMELNLRLKIAESELAYVKYREHYYQKARPEVKKETPKPEVKEEPQVKKVSEIEKIERPPLQALDDIEDQYDYTFDSAKAKSTAKKDPTEIYECGVCSEENSCPACACAKCGHSLCDKCINELHEATEESGTKAVLCIRCRVARWKNCPCFIDFAVQCHGKRCTSYGCKECFLAYREGGYFCPSCWEYETHRKPSPRPRPVSDTPKTKRIIEGWDGN